MNKYSMEREVKHKSNCCEWTPEVVYKVYCRDDLDTLPIGILEDMKQYIDEIIANRQKEEK